MARTFCPRRQRRRSLLMANAPRTESLPPTANTTPSPLKHTSAPCVPEHVHDCLTSIAAGSMLNTRWSILRPRVRVAKYGWIQ
eukprot:522637-Lingulodinium_polyedra.AAC.1